MNVKRSTKTMGLVALALLGAGTHNSVQAATRVHLNGQPLATSVAPIQRNNRTLVPMRDIFEALGATVTWNSMTQGITAQRGADRIRLQIGSRAAMVNGEQVWLDQPAILYRRSTMVPLRFVSESLGAQVQWNDARRLVSINTANGASYGTGSRYGTSYGTRYRSRYGSGQAVAGVRTISVPHGSVVPVRLDEQISSATAQVGERFTTSVESQRLGDSEFPPGSKIEGVVVEARPRTGANPGILDVDFRAVILPDGRRLPVRGELIALDNESVTHTTQGRIMSRNRSDRGDRLKIIGIGAAAGFVLGRVLDTNSVVTAVLGAAGGYLYSRNRDKDRAREAVLPVNTRLGVRLNSSVSYADADYYQHRARYMRL